MRLPQLESERCPLGHDEPPGQIHGEIAGAHQLSVLAGQTGHRERQEGTDRAEQPTEKVTCAVSANLRRRRVIGIVVAYPLNQAGTTSRSSI